MKTLAISMVLMAIAGTAAGETISVYAAGSLRAPLTEIGEAYRDKTGVEARFTFGASGLLRERIEKGEAADVFTSADTGHPHALSAAGLSGNVRVFTRNEMCVLASAKVKVNPDQLLDVLLDAAIKLGTSTPKADPSGDYAWKVFERAETVRAGSYAKLDAKALKLTGGPNSPPPPAGRNAYADFLTSGQADIFLTYCTNAALVVKEQPTLTKVPLPTTLAVGADYGVTVLKKAAPPAEAFVAYLLSPPAQAVFARHGFGALSPGK